MATSMYANQFSLMDSDVFYITLTDYFIASLWISQARINTYGHPARRLCSLFKQYSCSSLISSDVARGQSREMRCGSDKLV